MGAAHFWMESVRAALLMKDLAALLSIDASTAYTTGLLHAIGRLAINQVLVQLGQRLPVGPEMDAEAVEVRHTGLTYAEVGGLLLERWRFPNRPARRSAANSTPPSPRTHPFCRVCS